jgi:hypothetical protein
MVRNYAERPKETPDNVCDTTDTGAQSIVALGLRKASQKMFFEKMDFLMTIVSIVCCGILHMTSIFCALCIGI